MSTPSSRKRKQAALPSDLPPAASKCGGSDPKEPSEPTGTKYVPCHSGELGPDGKLVRFKDAPAHFRPVLTPRQMLLAGMHGGIYFNPKGGSAQPPRPAPGVLPVPRSPSPDTRDSPRSEVRIRRSARTHGARARAAFVSPLSFAQRQPS